MYVIRGKWFRPRAGVFHQGVVFLVHVFLSLCFHNWSRFWGQKGGAERGAWQREQQRKKREQGDKGGKGKSGRETRGQGEPWEEKKRQRKVGGGRGETGDWGGGQGTRRARGIGERGEGEIGDRGRRRWIRVRSRGRRFQKVSQG